MGNILLLTEPNFPCKQKERAHVCNLLSAAVTLFLGTTAVRLERPCCGGNYLQPSSRSGYETRMSSVNA